MKGNTQPSFYFSAYPLKAFHLKENKPKSTLKVTSKKEEKNSFSIGSKVLPLINPYKAESYKPEAPARCADAVQEETGVEWFCSYE